MGAESRLKRLDDFEGKAQPSQFETVEFGGIDVVIRFIPGTDGFNLPAQPVKNQQAEGRVEIVGLFGGKYRLFLEPLNLIAGAAAEPSARETHDQIGRAAGRERV